MEQLTGWRAVLGPHGMLALFPWCFLVWVVLTWTLTVEQLAFGVLAAALVTMGLSPRHRVPGPWRLFLPLNLYVFGRLLVLVVARVVVANVHLASLVWRPQIPVRSGMVVVPTRVSSSGSLTLVGLLSSLIVMNQIVDVDRERGQMQYHTVDAPADTDEAYDTMNGPIERILAGWERR
ncbi:MAG TPA: Na+/H+ antiporter subunit E [Streptosporangiales bacterium]